MRISLTKIREASGSSPSKVLSTLKFNNIIYIGINKHWKNITITTLVYL